MKKYLLIACAGLALSLGACTSKDAAGPTYPVVGTVDQTTMEQSAFAARSTFGALQHLARQYTDLPRCVAGGPSVCSSQSLVDDIRRYVEPADVATKGAQDIARAPTKTPVAFANAVADAQRAVAVFRATVAKFNPQAAMEAK